MVHISVIMTVFNTDYTLIKRAIDSVLNQHYQNFELIIIDDGSMNDPHHKLLNYVKQISHKTSYLFHKNKGQAESINQGILFAKGAYITIIDADDEYKPNHLSSCLEAIKGYDLIASSTETIVDEDEDFYVPDRMNQQMLIHVDDCILFATLFGKKEVFTAIRFEKKYAADAHFYETASLMFKVRKVNSRTYVYYRNSPNSICSQLKKFNLANAN